MKTQTQTRFTGPTSQIMKPTFLSSLLVAAVIGTTATFASAVVVNLDGLSNTDWASPTDNLADPARYNSAVVTVDSVVVGDRAGAPIVGDGSNTATLDVSDFLEDGEGNPSGATLAYTVGGLDIDGVGGFNDSFVLSFTVTASSGGVGTPGFAVDDDPNDEPLNQGYLNLQTGGNINVDGEFIAFAFGSLVVNLNGGTGNGSGTFDGFEGVALLNTTATTTAKVNGVTQSAGTSVVDLTPGGLDAGLLLEHGGAGRFYAGTWDVQVTVFAAAVPTPAALPAGLALLALTATRRRRG